jgi:hypothetical protein
LTGRDQKAFKIPLSRAFDHWKHLDQFGSRSKYEK